MPKAPSKALSVTLAALRSVMLLSKAGSCTASTTAGSGIVLLGNGTDLVGTGSIAGRST